MKKKFKIRHVKPIIIAIFALILFLFAIKKYIVYNAGEREKDVKNKIQEKIIAKKSQLEKALYSRIYYTKSVAAYVSINNTISDESFQVLAGECVKNDTVISSMSLSPNCVISSIYPPRGHEAAIGLKLLLHPERKKIVESTIATQNTFVAGPVELIEGGIAFISYTPIFTGGYKNETNFWGVTDIVINRDKLFNEVKLYTEDEDAYYALQGIDGLGEKGGIFWGDKQVFEKDPISVNVLLPTGRWILAASAKRGWIKDADITQKLIFFLYLGAIIISVLIWLLAHFIFKMRASEKELKALFGSMSELIIEFNRKGEYVKIAPTNEDLLIHSPEELIGKTLFDFFPLETAKFFNDAIQDAFSKKGRVTIEYPLTVKGQEKWFLARLTYVSENSVLYVAHDNTDKKHREEELKKSALTLKELNNTKDKFFSIVAHDLKNPLATFKMILEEMETNYETFSDNERKEYIKLLNASSANLFALLENLLTWSRSQRGLLSFNPEPVNLDFIIRQAVLGVSHSAEKKKIEIISNIEAGSSCIADANMLTTVFRNLLTNAIKFTKEEGKIYIKSDSNFEPDFIKISIIDTGVGMPKDKIPDLFRLDSQFTTLGTNKEKGTGLGLILCKEFIEKNGGKIWAESELDKGSSFSFTLPLNKK